MLLVINCVSAGSVVVLMSRFPLLSALHIRSQRTTLVTLGTCGLYEALQHCSLCTF